MPTRALLISTYDLGHQPFGLASPAAWLRRAGLEVRCADLSKQRLDEQTLRDAHLVAIHLPMHTATRLAEPVIRRVRIVNPSARICAFGLYAPLNAEWLRTLGVHDVIGGEFEDQLAAVGHAVATASDPWPSVSGMTLPRLRFLVPDRTGLPPLASYAALELGDGSSRLAGYTEASRGCRHLCRHCPVVPVYGGQFRVVQTDVVLADIAAQIDAGAEHITFGDPDFFNGPTHAMRIVDALHAAHPSVTYDVTIKIEHLLQHRALLPRLRDTGCLFVTSAVESIDDRVLAILEKGHTRQDFVEAVEQCRSTDVTLVPTFVAFHPWLSLAGYCDLLDTIAALDLVEHVAPIQLTIRLLVPQGSRLLESTEMRPFVGAFDPKTLAYRWSNHDHRVERLHQDITELVGARLTTERAQVFGEISALAHERAGLDLPDPRPPSRARRPIPFMNEPWYCCAEPNPEQLRLI